MSEYRFMPLTIEERAAVDLRAQHDALSAKVKDLEGRFKALLVFVETLVSKGTGGVGSEIIDELVKLRRENEELRANAEIEIKVLQQSLDVAKNNAQVYRKQANDAHEKIESLEASYRSDFDRLQQVIFDVHKEVQKHLPPAQCPTNPVEAIRAVHKQFKEGWKQAADQANATRDQLNGQLVDALNDAKLLRDDLAIAKKQRDEAEQGREAANQRANQKENDLYNLQQEHSQALREMNQHLPVEQKTLLQAARHLILRMESAFEGEKQAKREAAAAQNIVDRLGRRLDPDMIEDAQAYRALRQDPKVRITSWNVTKAGVAFRVEGSGVDPLRFKFSDDLVKPKFVVRLISALSAFLAGEFNHPDETRGSHG